MTGAFVLLIKATLILIAAAVVLRGLMRRSSAAAQHAAAALAVGALLLLPVLARLMPRLDLAVLPAAPHAPAGETRPAPPLHHVSAETPDSPPVRERPAVLETRPAATPLRRPATEVVREEAASAGSRTATAPYPTAVANPRPAGGPPLAASIAAFWTLGTLVVLARLLLGLGRARLIVRRAHPMGEVWAARQDECAARLGLRRRAVLLESDAVVVPVVWGERPPTILFPPECAAWSEERCRALLLHELAHVARRDWLVQMLAGVVRALYWPHPLVWWIVRRLRRDAERASDDRVLASGVAAPDLARELLETARALSGSAPLRTATAVAEGSNVEERIVALIDPVAPRRAPTRRTLSAAALSAALLVAAFAALQPVARAAVARVVSDAAALVANEARRDEPRHAAPEPPRVGSAPREGAESSFVDTVPTAEAPRPFAAASFAAPEEPAAPAPAPSRAPTAAPGLVVRIGVDLVQVDAVVTDGGRHVTDLTAPDFEVFQDGRPQKITNVQYVSSQSSPRLAGAREPLRPEQVKRSIALVVNDLTVSFTSYAYLRQSLRRFVDEQMGEGDLVAVVHTGRDLGILQQFTTDKRVLRAAIDDIPYNLWAHSLRDQFQSPDNTRGHSSTLPDASYGGEVPLGGRGRTNIIDPTGFERYHRERMMAMTLQGLRFVIEGLRDLPGRKSMVLFSEGLAFPDEENVYRWSSSPDFSAVREIVDAATRSAVVIYGVDPRGIHAGMMAARVLSSMATLADATGGAVFSHNDIADSIARVLEDQPGYYLIGYEPDAASFDRVRGRPIFRRLTVRVKRPGLRVRTRRGFLGVPDTERPPTSPEPLSVAAVSPFPAQGLPTRMSTLFGRDAKSGYVVRSFVHVDGDALTFGTDEAAPRATVAIQTFVVDENGFTRGQMQRRVDVPVPAAQIPSVRQAGLVFQFDIALENPGAYQVRTAVRDVASDRVGSAAQLVVVPNLREPRLALSDIVIGTTGPLVGEAPARDVRALSYPADVSPVLRRFHPGGRVAYGFAVYNARRDEKRPAEPLHLEWRLLREGRAVLSGPSSPIATSTRDARGFAVAGMLELPEQLAPGEYALETTVTDPLVEGRRGTATRQVALDVVP